MPENNIAERIQSILDKHDTIPQSLKDELILMGIAEVLRIVTDHTRRIEFLERYKPYLQGLVWAVGAIALMVLTMVVTGKLHVTVLP